MKLKFTYSLYIILIVFAIACSVKPEFPVEPKIEYVSISKTHVNEFDTLWVKLNFQDGDGNLGKQVNLNATCKTNCEYESDSSCYKDPFYGAFLIDMRDSCYVFHDLPDFEPDGKIKAVSGELLLNIPLVFCKKGACTTCTEDTLVYKILVRDIDQNFSNAVFTDTIYISCQ